MIAVVSWMGGIVYVNIILLPSMQVLEPPQQGKLMSAIAKRFSVLAWSSIIVLVVTGGHTIFTMGILFDFTTSYGMWLNSKILLALVMILVGLYITLFALPKIESLAPKPDEKPSSEFIKIQKRIPFLSRVMLVLGIMVLLCTAMF